MMDPIISISNIHKVFPGNFTALENINLDIYPGEIFALLGPNGAGKTTLISIICGTAKATQGQITVSGHDIIKDFKNTRSLIGLVPQELTTDAFETVWDTVNFSRGLFGLPPNPTYIEKILKDLTLWEKRNNRLMTLSGGMKRRVLIAKALSHEPRILFLDEPTAGVDVELRKDMWRQVHALRESGVTVILTTHYIDEAEEMADRIGVINKGNLIVVEEKSKLIEKLGTRQLSLELREPLAQLPSELDHFDIKIEGQFLTYTYDSRDENNCIAEIFQCLSQSNIEFKDLNTKQSSLEEIFVKLVNEA